ncbi:MAG: hypothetical protein E3J72_15445 [Planctomycetota bacterium]|nr:MAG: hypothetical protein E3J72_15445 [Planctomycetota bacterium]
MIKNTGTQKRALAALNIILILLLAYIVFEIYTGNRKFGEEVAAARARQADMARLEEDVALKNRQIEDLEEFNLHATAIIPADKESTASDFLALYGEFVTRSGVKSSGLQSAGAPEGEGELLRFRNRAEVTGSFESIVKFLNAIESSGRLFKIDGFAIKSVKPEARRKLPPQRHCVVTFSTYAFK